MNTVFCSLSMNRPRLVHIAYSQTTKFKVDVLASNIRLLMFLCVVAVVITPPLPRDGGTARTTIQVHAVNLIEIRLGVTSMNSCSVCMSFVIVDYHDG